MLKTLGRVIVVLLATGAMLACLSNRVEQPKVRSGVWFETAYAEWQENSADDQFSVKIRLNNGEWQDVDSELVRKFDAADGTWRVDVPGLRNTAGTSYDLQILDASSKEVHLITGLVPQSFDRQGYAFSLNATNGLTTTTGGYNPDGTVRGNAKIVYVTNENKDETLTSGTYNNNTANPLIIRFIGQVGFKGADARERGDIPAAANDMRMYTIQGGKDITIEGIGPDAYIEGWGLSLNNNSNVVVRNLSFDWWYDDAVYINASNNSHANSHTWITHNIFGYGQNRYEWGLGEADHVKGDGATDIGNGATHFTVSYNRYNESGKSMLVGGGNSASIGHGTIHHNWFNKTSERTPRLRNGWVHVFNNIYDYVGGEPGDGMGYGIAAGNRSNIVSEGNTFIHTYRPYIISGERSSNSAGENIDGSANTLSNDAPGIIITSLAANSAVIAGRVLLPDVLDSWSKNTDWYFEQELTLPNGPTITNNARPNGETYSYTFVPFNVAANYRTDGVTGGPGAPAATPNVDFTPRAAINDTLIGIGVQSAADSAERVRQMAGVMPR